MDIIASNHLQSLTEALRKVYNENATGSGPSALMRAAESLKSSVDTSGVTPEEVAFVKSYLSENQSVQQAFGRMQSMLDSEVSTVESYLDSGMSVNEAGVLPFLQKTAEGLVKIFFDIIKSLVTTINKGLNVAFSTKFGKQLGMGVIVLVFVDLATQSMAIADTLHNMGVVGKILLALYEPAAAAILSLGQPLVSVLAGVLLLLFLMYAIMRK